MGLDMYLEKKTYVKQWDHIAAENQFAVTVGRGGKPYAAIKSERVSYVIEEVAYWRKANAIHKWFVDNCGEGKDECQPIYVSAEHMKALLEVVSGLLKTKDAEEAALILPPTNGFFFGSTEINEYYWSDLEYTKEILEAEIAAEATGDYYYNASW
jgi:hypothetical protein